jgi:hypothetical protein
MNQEILVWLSKYFSFETTIVSLLVSKMWNLVAVQKIAYLKPIITTLLKNDIDELSEIYSGFYLLTEIATIREKYFGLERILWDHVGIMDTFLKKYPLLGLGGFVHYMMTKDEMKHHTVSKLIEMRNNGLLLTKNEFIENDEWFPRDSIDLTRIWGADFLNKRFLESGLDSEFKVPDYVIVVPNLEFDVEISFWSSHLPILSKIGDRSGNYKLYFIKIVGPPVGNQCSHILEQFNYYDTRDPVAENYNVIQENRINYVVDTEWKSFLRSSILPSNFPRLYRELLLYMKNRFHIHNSGTGMTFKVSLCD